MKTRIFSLLVLAMLAISTLSAQTSFQSGLEKAKTSNKKVLVNIYSDSDTWSQKMDAVYSTGSIMNYINENFVYVKLNGAGSDLINYNGKGYTSASLAKFLGATGYPSHVFLAPDGTVLKFTYNGESMSVFSGYVDAPEFEKLLKYFAENKYQNTDLGKVL
ncbi:MAG: DUF255 domain-containing protein [Candidatus Kapaibacterium sp.]